MNEVKTIMTRKKMFGPCAAALVGLLLVCMAVAPVSAESGPMRAEYVPGGSLLIDETKGVDCTASPIAPG